MGSMPIAAPPDTAALAARLRLSVTRMARRLRQEAETGITPSMLSALAAVERHGELTMGHLCEAERVTPPTMTRVVAALVDAGLVSRDADAEDGRVAWVRLTPAGGRLIERSRRRKDAYLTKALRRLEPDQVRTLDEAAEILERLTEGSS